MEYLTATEISQKWNVSGRMVAYYCEAGRIEGAVKKGKTWFIPVAAKKPIDGRSLKKTIKTKEGSSQGEIYAINEEDEEHVSAIYHTKEVSHHLGLTRETLRYYEEIGLIKPKRSSSQYREFDMYDISRLLSIDFYKKRGFSPVEIKELLMAAGTQEYERRLQSQLNALQEHIARFQEMQKRLKETTDFFSNVNRERGEFMIRELPPYYVREKIPSVTSFREYKEKVLRFLNLENEDILSNMVRAITFDESGFKGSEMYVVKPAVLEDQKRQSMFLEHGNCLYTTVLADNNDTTVPEKMFLLCHEWAAKHQMSFRGVVYIFVRFVMLDDQTDKHLYEVWVPLCKP